MRQATTARGGVCLHVTSIWVISKVGRYIQATTHTNQVWMEVPTLYVPPALPSQLSQRSTTGLSQLAFKMPLAAPRLSSTDLFCLGVPVLPLPTFFISSTPLAHRAQASQHVKMLPTT